MIVDPATGRFTLASGTVLGPELTRSAFLASPEGRGATVFAQNEPWCSYRFVVPGEPLVMVVFFNGDALDALSLAVDDPSLGAWSKAGEMGRVNANDAWLAAHDIATGSRAWGSVWSGYDDKSGSGHVVIRFRR